MGRYGGYILIHEHREKEGGRDGNTEREREAGVGDGVGWGIRQTET